MAFTNREKADLMTNKPVSPWPAGTDCPEPAFPAFKKALLDASFHSADDSGGEWGSAGDRMREAARIAVEAEWPYWAIKRMYGEIKPLPSFDDFMGRYCVALRAPSSVPVPDAITKAVEALEHVRNNSQHPDQLVDEALAALTALQQEPSPAREEAEALVRRLHNAKAIQLSSLIREAADFIAREILGEKS